jgi:hypothetical protein
LAVGIGIELGSPLNSYYRSGLRDMFEEKCSELFKNRVLKQFGNKDLKSEPINS